ncbi:topology modulation protein [Liquorilactobacillus satsumensis]|uniref:topology modulation protein n=1 Tax=Liquorilactobacillus satsumensis TaxID=259059 RepID=UPI001E5B468B|nr:topology modulation protein [Liquorilactobacillus satsumensis]MCC7667715.1 topology modulation protein [Liquorilactobacillus satsumensis]MCP9313032.1 topology modulation protein [Liquorilactobacillus satsumensis]MCP9357687.1 topology modulation protein [Liquorilactobacillus satsumensis]MCP9360188.1 topology modulation protein [Liquorilactobacillus satsumensis]MCP9371427.1 topology modulation protein [Liquorilactobacillus satsumensis]
MHIIIIGNCGSGKSTLAKKINQKMNYPLLHLDSLWHSTDYSAAAKGWFSEQQRRFMQQKNWIIEGNYYDTLPLRLAEADFIIWLKVGRLTALWRVIKRSLKFHYDKKSRTEMPSQFSEHFNREYWDFLRFVYSYDEHQTEQLVQEKRQKHSVVLIVKSQRAKDQLQERLLRLKRLR